MKYAPPYTLTTEGVSISFNTIGEGSVGVRINRESVEGSKLTIYKAGTPIINTQFNDDGTIQVRTSEWRVGGVPVCISEGVLTTCNSESKYRLNQRVISSCELDTSAIYNIETKVFEYTPEKGGYTSFGPSIEEVASILPQLVYFENNKPVYIQETKVVWLLLEEMRKLQDKVIVLENRKPSEILDSFMSATLTELNDMILKQQQTIESQKVIIDKQVETIAKFNTVVESIEQRILQSRLNNYAE